MKGLRWETEANRWTPVVDGVRFTRGVCLEQPSTDPEDLAYMAENYGFEPDPNWFYYFDGEVYFTEAPDYFSDVQDTGLAEAIAAEINGKLQELNSQDSE